MSEVLRQFVVDNIWCTPDQDYQSIYRPKKITRKNGVFKHVQTLRDQYRLPRDDVQYHVYQIGQVPPRLLGWEEGDRLAWVSLSDLINQYPLIIDAYTASGQQFPRFETYLLWTPSKNLLVAVPRLSGHLDLNVEDLYLRFYTNAYYASDRFTGAVTTASHGRHITSENERVAFQTQFNTYKDRSDGAVKCIVDGKLIKVPSVMTLPLGSWAEFVYDASVKSVVRVPYSELKVFESSVDGVRKYLLHLPKEAGSTIHYKDDLDIHLWKKTTESLQDGTYYHQNQLSHVRMLTHQDYALPVSVLAQYTTDLALWQDITSVEIEVWVRHSGYDRPLVHEHHRIQELYKLTDDEIVRAMLGSTSAVVEWRAETLEASAYPAMMRTGRPSSLDPVTMYDGFGYNAAAKILCPNPAGSYEYQSEVVANRPPLCQQECLALEYAQGHLVQVQRITAPGSTYRTQGTDVDMVEFYPGPVGPNGQRFYDEAVIRVLNEVTVHLYKCPRVGGEPNLEWVRADVNDYTVTADDEQTTYTSVLNAQQWSTVFLTDEGVTFYGQMYPAHRDIVKLTLGVGVSREGVWGFESAIIPFDYLQIIMNGYSLVEGIDYTVNWPEVIIHTHQGLDTSTDLQRVQVLMMGLPKDGRMYMPRKDVGFVVNGRLSDDHRYQVRDDRVSRLIVDGAVVRVEESHFAEDGQLLGVPVNNGTPYSVRTPPMALSPMDGRDRYAFIQASRDLDDRIGTWMTERYPQPEAGTSVFPRKYVLVSPFLSTILYDMLDGILPTDQLTDAAVTDVQLYDLLETYLPLLSFDPARQVLDPHVAVHPHGQNAPVVVTRIQHTVLVRANYLMLGQRVETHELLRVGA